MRDEPGRTDASPFGSRVAIAAGQDLLAADGRSLESANHILGGVVGHLDERKAVGNLDCADRTGVDARLVGDRANEIGRPNASLATETDEQPRDLSAVAA